MRNSYLAAGIIFVLLLVGAFLLVRNRMPRFNRAAQGPTPTIMVATESTTNQITASKHSPSKTVVIDSVTLSKPGFIAIYENQNGQAGAILGTSGLLPAGTTQNVVIELSRKSNNGEELLATTHLDNGDSRFEFPGPDEVGKDENGNTVQTAFQVTAETSGFQIPATGLGE